MLHASVEMFLFISVHVSLKEAWFFNNPIAQSENARAAGKRGIEAIAFPGLSESSR